jgi:AraC-like DNA-binding protein
MGFLGKNKNGGRPAFRPTRRMRSRIEVAAAAGVSAAEIAAVLKIARQTLETHFNDELRLGRVRKLLSVLDLLEKSARRGSVSAMKYLTSVYSQQASVKIGKKEAKIRAAKEAVASSEWADILGPRSSTDGPAA